MTAPVQISFAEKAEEGLAEQEGNVALLVDRPAALKILPNAAKRAAARVVESERWQKLDAGAAISLAYPAGMEAALLQLVKLSTRPDIAEARKAGASIATAHGAKPLAVIAGKIRNLPEMLLGLKLRAYDFDLYRSTPEAGDGADADGAKKGYGPVTVHHDEPDALRQEVEDAAVDARAEAVFLTRNLVNEPANILTTTAFAERLSGLEALGIEVEVLDEAALEELGARALLAVGQGSESPSKVVIMRWNGGGDEAPLALVGKGVVFDTGGISIKPAGGMEEMTMDMGGAGVVAGVMQGLAARRARANVVGLVGLVENMPDGRAQRPGDIVRSMKGDTIEVINTDAEGRLVLADVLWLAQQRFNPSAIIDLATLTGAAIIALGHENAGVFSNDDALVNALLKAAETEGEGAWRLPLGKGYDEQIKSRLADVKNTGGRPAGASTAAAFLQRFVRQDLPWVHIDIAGVALLSKDTDFAPKGATGWGVLSLDRLIAERFETGDTGTASA